MNMNNSQKNNVRVDQCPECQYKITLATNDCIICCPKCKKNIVFLCHIIQANKQGDYQCSKCQHKYTLVKCPQCECYWAIKDFQNGHQIICNNCKFQGVMVICPNPKCLRFLCFPLFSEDQFFLNHQRSKIECKKCRTLFRYWICKTCYWNVFTVSLDKNEDSKIFICKNKNCPSYNQHKESSWPQKQKRRMCKTCKRYQAINKECESNHAFCEQCLTNKKAINCNQCLERSNFVV